MKAYSYWLFTHDGKCNKFGVYIQLRKCANNNVLCTLQTHVSCELEMSLVLVIAIFSWNTVFSRISQLCNAAQINSLFSTVCHCVSWCVLWPSVSLQP